MLEEKQLPPLGKLQAGGTGAKASNITSNKKDFMDRIEAICYVVHSYFSAINITEFHSVS